MALEEYHYFIYPAIAIFSVLTAIFAVKTLLFIRKQKKDEKTKSILLRVFSLLALGYIFWALAEIAWDIHVKLLGADVDYSIIADPLWAIGYIPLVAGFSYLSYKLYKSHKTGIKGIQAGIITALIAALVYYIVSSSIVPFIWDEGVLLGIVGVYYPVASAVAIASAVSVLLFFRKADISKSLMLLTVSLFFSFAGDMMYTYEVWHELGYGVLGVLYDTCYAAEYAIAAYAFYLFSSSKEEEENNQNI